MSLMTLSDLSEDVLSQVLRLIPFSALSALYTTGDRRLLARFYNGGVEELFIDVSTSKSAWPSRTFQFRLKSLSVTWALPSPGFRLPVGVFLRTELLRTWPDLESLSLNGPSVETVFESSRRPSSTQPSIPDAIQGDATPTPAIQGESNADYAQGEPQDVADGWNMARSHPKLKRFSVNFQNKFCKSTFQRLSIPSYLTLSRSLTYLSLTDTFMELKEEDCLNLPPQLETLILPGEFGTPPINELNIRCLPSSLTHINSKDRKHMCFTIQALIVLAKEENTILPNLVTFPLPRAHPNTLLEIYEAKGGAWSNKPVEVHIDLSENDKSLISRQTEWVRVRHFSSVEWMEMHLPRTITSLTTPKIDWDAIQDSSIWPASLTSLMLEVVNTLKCSHFKKLPRMLRTLMVNGGSQGFENSTPVLEGRQVLDTIDKDRWQVIKEKLLRTEANYPNLTLYIACVEGGHLCGLPLHLEDLSIGALVYTCPLMLLPPLLTRFAGRNSQSTVFSLMRALPPFLTDLTLNLACLRTQPHRPLSESSTAGLLSSRVSRLKLNSSEELSEVVHLFPKDLRNLTLDMKIRPDTLQKLPQGLVSLKFKSVSWAVSDWKGWGGSLPRSLQKLSLPQGYPLRASEKKGMPSTVVIIIK